MKPQTRVAETERSKGGRRKRKGERNSTKACTKARRCPTAKARSRAVTSEKRPRPGVRLADRRRAIRRASIRKSANRSILTAQPRHRHESVCLRPFVERRRRSTALLSRIEVSTMRSGSDNPLASLRRLAESGERYGEERCDLCGAWLATEHVHLVEPAKRTLLCACDACATLFASGGETRYRRVPRRVLFLPDFKLTDEQWDGLMIPINLAFFFRSTPQDCVVALYPSPAGPTESLLSLEAWEELATDNPVLRSLEPDVEALLINRLREAEHYIAPIDECYRLVGLIRLHWRGLGGGARVWDEIAAFFDGLRARSRGGTCLS